MFSRLRCVRWGDRLLTSFLKNSQDLKSALFWRGGYPQCLHLKILPNEVRKSNLFLCFFFFFFTLATKIRPYLTGMEFFLLLFRKPQSPVIASHGGLGSICCPVRSRISSRIRKTNWGRLGKNWHFFTFFPPCTQFHIIILVNNWNKLHKICFVVFCFFFSP